MKANELMIGDLVLYNEAHQQILEISGIDDEVYLETDELVHQSEIQPIPLTPEILERNGFEKVLDEDGTECYRYYNHAADGYIKISLYDSGDGDWSIEIINYEKFDDNKIMYNNNFIFLKVHQLQHALRLCGIEKEIEL